MMIINSIKPDKFNADYQRLMALIYSVQKYHQTALEHINKAIQLRPFFSQLYWERSQIYRIMGESEKSLKDIRQAHRLSPSSKMVLEGMAVWFAKNIQYDSTIFYAQKLIYADSTRANGYYLLAKSYALTGDLTRARENLDILHRFIENDSSLVAKYEEVDSLINNIDTSPIDNNSDNN
jgi:tetratricopeptide (TPR) repeat protein